MLRIRDTENKTKLLTAKDRFVEICSADGLVAAVFVQDNDGSVVQIMPNTQEAFRYTKAYGVKWAVPIALR